MSGDAGGWAARSTNWLAGCATKKQANGFPLEASNGPFLDSLFICTTWSMEKSH